MSGASLLCAGRRITFLDDGAGPPVLVLHGFTGSSAAMEAVLASLVPTHRVVAPDLLGHGHSEAPADSQPYTVSAAVAQLEGLLDHLDLATVDIVGYSLGGRLALSFAAHSPNRVRRMVLVGATGGLDDEPDRAERRAADEILARTIETDGIEPFVDQWERLPIFATQLGLPDAIRNGIRRTRLQNSPTGLANSLRGLGAGQMPQLWDRLPQLDQPTLVVAGGWDTKYVSIGRRLVDAMPRAEIYIVPGAGHAAHIEAPDLVGAALVEFLDRS